MFLVKHWALHCTAEHNGNQYPNLLPLIWPNQCPPQTGPQTQVLPYTSLIFPGITLDTVRMEIRLPGDKVKCIRDTLQAWLGRKKATKQQILSLVSLLQHAIKVVKCGRTFVSWLYATAMRINEMYLLHQIEC